MWVAVGAAGHAYSVVKSGFGIHVSLPTIAILGPNFRLMFGPF